MISNAARALTAAKEFVEQLEAVPTRDDPDSDYAQRLDEARALLKAIVAEGGALMLDAADLLRRSLVIDLAIVQRSRSRGASGLGPASAGPRVVCLRPAGPAPDPPFDEQFSPAAARSGSPDRMPRPRSPGRGSGLGRLADASGEIADLERCRGTGPLDEAARARAVAVREALMRGLMEHRLGAGETVEAADLVRRALALQLGCVAPPAPSRRLLGAGVARQGRASSHGLPVTLVEPAIAERQARESTAPRPTSGARGVPLESGLVAVAPASTEVLAPPRAAPALVGALIAARAIGVVLVLFVLYALLVTSYAEGHAQRSMSAATHIRISAPDIGLDQLVLATDSRAALAEGPGLTPGSGAPGAARPIVIAGHRTTNGAPFRHLSALKPGNVVDLRTPAGVTYRYTVERTMTVDAGAVVPVPAGDQALFLISATPPYHDSRRFVVVGQLDTSGGTVSPAGSLRLPSLGGSGAALAGAVLMLLLLGVGWAGRSMYKASIPRWAAIAAWLPATALAYVSWQLLLASMSRLV